MSVRSLDPFPPLAPYRTGRLHVPGGHVLHHEESGRPDGKPVVCLHGGPGAGSDPGERRLFDPDVYRIVQVDQRGAGRSTPLGSTDANTTWDLVADLELLREHLGIARWQLFGGSWGATLALAYAETHPDRVSELVLRGVFLVRPEELAWFYGGGAGALFPEGWGELVGPLAPAEQGDVIGAYHARVFAPDPAVSTPAARAWSRWEARTCTLLPDEAVLAMLDDDERATTLARLELHYFAHGAWLAGRELLAGVPRIAHLPCAIVQGRYDMVCPLRSAWQLAKAWPSATLEIVDAAGHAAHEPAIAEALVRATQRFALG